MDISSDVKNKDQRTTTRDDGGFLSKDMLSADGVQQGTPKPKSRGGYRVPDGYFSDLNQAIRCRVAESIEVQHAEAEYAARGIWGRVKGLAGFAGAFGCLVLLAMAGFYFTGHRAQIREADEADPLLGYTLYTEDVEMLASLAEASPTQEEGVLFAQAVKEYLSTYGSGTLDNETLFAMAEE